MDATMRQRVMSRTRSIGNPNVCRNPEEEGQSVQFYGYSGEMSKDRLPANPGTVSRTKEATSAREREGAISMNSTS